MSRPLPALPLAALLLLSTTPAAHAACPATASDLSVAVNASEAAFSAMNLEAFEQARTDALEMLPCLEEQLPPANVASLHRMQAFAAFVAQDDPSAIARFRAALGLQAGYRLPSSIAPEGSPLQLLYGRANQAEPSPTQPFHSPTDISLYVDGLLSTSAPTEIPYLLQVLAVDGAVSWSGYLEPGAPLPDLVIAPPAPEPAPLPLGPDTLPSPPAQPKPSDGFPIGRTIAVGTSVATTAVLSVLALRAHSDWQTIHDSCTTKVGGCSTATLDNMNAEQQQAIGLGISAGVFGALSIGLGISLAF